MMSNTLFPMLALAGVLAAQSPSLTPLEKEFQEALTGVTLQGQSTRDGAPGVSEDSYDIERVVKQAGDTWLFYVNVVREGRKITVPLPIEVKWAGDTPVITLTDAALPGMGTYTARVVVYRGHYAGTWSETGRSGKVFGRIVKR